MSEQTFIPDTDEIKILRKEKNELLLCKFKQKQINIGFVLLKQILHREFGRCSLSLFIDNANTIFNYSDRISEHIKDFFDSIKSPVNTRRISLYMLKKILETTSISDSFLKKLTIKEKKVCVSRNDHSLSLIKKYNIMENDNPVKMLLVLWINTIKVKSNNRSPPTIKSMLSFYLNTCLPVFGVTIDKFDPSKIILTQQTVETICKNLKQFNWLKLFCKELINIEFNFSKDFLKLDTVNSWKEYYNGDKHVIPASELDLIYNQTLKSDVFDQLMYLTFITTGIRVGGFVKIKLLHVCNIKNNKVTVFENGRTLEKGNKWFEFSINTAVSDLFTKWIMFHRKGDSEYLFPSSVTKTGYISTNMVRSRFGKLCEKAAIQGSHLHLHSIRHSYAHILLKCGNKISDISKLMNHSNTQTTEQFYLKESISEVVDRANIPWIDNNKKPKDVIPKFLNTINDKKETNSKKQERMKRRMEAISNFKIG